MADDRELRVVPEERYADFSSIGHGGMGVVFLALDTELSRRVALKVVRPDQTEEPESTSPLTLAPPGDDTPASKSFRTLSARFLQEAQVTGGLEHPGIVPVYEVGQTPAGVPYYTMRFVRGEKTFEDAIREAETLEDRMALLEPFLKVCDAVSYAHAKQVIHRDLKPANIALGEFGEVVLLDWGLAKLLDRPDLQEDQWQVRIRQFREATDLETVAGALGTPGYMSPEAVLGDPKEVDEQSDVYSLGCILYRIVAGRLPHEFTSFGDLLGKLLEDEPAPPHEIETAAPEALSLICLQALAREKSRRTATSRELASAIRSWQRESALSREVEGRVREARAAWEGTEGLAGEDLLRQLDRVIGGAGRALELDPGSMAAASLVRRAEGARTRAVAEREQAARSRVFRRVAAVGLILALLTAGVVAWLVEGKRKEAVRAEEMAAAARDRAEKQRAEKETALAEVLRLADVKKVRDLIAEADELWPLTPEMRWPMAGWLADVRKIEANRKVHEDLLAEVRARAYPYTEAERLRDHRESLARLEEARAGLAATQAGLVDLRESGSRDEESVRELAVLEAQEELYTREVAEFEAKVEERGSWRFPSDTDAWQHEVLSELVKGIERLVDGKSCLKLWVATRHVFVASVERSSIETRRTAWSRTIAEIANRERSPRYDGLTIEPIVGLVPLGKDPDSGLHEFAHLGSGRLTERDPETGELDLWHDSSIVLVLIPGGSFMMGAQKDDPDAPNYDPLASADEIPVRKVSVGPFLLSKYECTQAQYRQMTGGAKPSHYETGAVVGKRVLDERNPVEQITWEQARKWSRRHRLRLPTEAEWEYACRAGTNTPWCFGGNVADLGRYANISDAYLMANEGHPAWKYTVEVDDGHSVHASVGTYAANALGLHEMHGNVWEWCEDLMGPYEEAPTDGSARTRVGVRRGRVGRISRGGSWAYVLKQSRASARYGGLPGMKSYDLGLRPAASLPE